MGKFFISKLLLVHCLFFYRRVPIHAFFASSGSGKTHALDEIAICMKNHVPDSGVFRISFNNLTHFTEGEECICNPLITRLLFE